MRRRDGEVEPLQVGEALVRQHVADQENTTAINGGLEPHSAADERAVRRLENGLEKNI